MITKKDFTFTSTEGKHEVHAVKWESDSIPKKGIVQLVHGMCEYIGRYNDFAEYLVNNGYVVVGHDHLGHGQTAKNREELGYFADNNGFKYLVEDVEKLRKLTHEEYPYLPYHILGHSMGSFVLRIYLTKYAAGLASATVMGTGNNPPMVIKFGRKIAARGMKKNGTHYRSEFLNKMAFGSYNKKFKNEGLAFAWLSRDRKNCEDYAVDPFTQFIFTLKAYDDMFIGLSYLNEPNNV
ncbi:MAG: alpha/beta hydrolase, partial [Synergistes sp.]|nr:alpha/beta hydrolase [Synergistes sp.]